MPLSDYRDSRWRPAPQGRRPPAAAGGTVNGAQGMTGSCQPQAEFVLPDLGQFRPPGR